MVCALGSSFWVIRRSRWLGHLRASHWWCCGLRDWCLLGSCSLATSGSGGTTCCLCSGRGWTRLMLGAAATLPARHCTYTGCSDGGAVPVFNAPFQKSDSSTSDSSLSCTSHTSFSSCRSSEAASYSSMTPWLTRGRPGQEVRWLGAALWSGAGAAERALRSPRGSTLSMRVSRRWASSRARS